MDCEGVTPFQDHFNDVYGVTYAITVAQVDLRRSFWKAAAEVGTSKVPLVKVDLGPQPSP